MITNLKQLCDSIIESADKATARPWTHTIGIDADGEFSFVGNPIPDQSFQEHMRSAIAHLKPHDESNGCFIVLAANNAEKLARALLVMEEALQTVGCECCLNFRKGFHKSHCIYLKAHEALARANEILERK